MSVHAQLPQPQYCTLLNYKYTSELYTLLNVTQTCINVVLCVLLFYGSIVTLLGTCTYYCLCDHESNVYRCVYNEG